MHALTHLSSTSHSQVQAQTHQQPDHLTQINPPATRLKFASEYTWTSHAHQVGEDIHTWESQHLIPGPVAVIQCPTPDSGVLSQDTCLTHTSPISIRFGKSYQSHPMTGSRRPTLPPVLHVSAALTPVVVLHSAAYSLNLTPVTDPQTAHRSAKQMAIWDHKLWSPCKSNHWQ